MHIADSRGHHHVDRTRSVRRRGHAHLGRRDHAERRPRHRDYARALLEQIMFPPVVPWNEYPLIWEKFHKVDNPDIVTKRTVSGTTGGWFRPRARTRVRGRAAIAPLLRQPERGPGGALRGIIRRSLHVVEIAHNEEVAGADPALA
jgi:hypothetical protein